MSKNKAPTTTTAVDLSQYCKSTFTLTFTVEVLGVEVYYDCNEGKLELGPCSQGMKIQYQLYPGQFFDVDILIWPHVAKIWCGNQCGWVRTWQLLERRWLAFSIRHAFPVRVVGLQSYVATVVPTVGLGSLGTTAKNDKNAEVYLPPLVFGQRRYFAPVLVAEEDSFTFFQELIWSAIVDYIPSSYLDGVFDVPHAVVGNIFFRFEASLDVCNVAITNEIDIRHQDTCLDYVKDNILSRTMSEESEEFIQEEQVVGLKDRRTTTTPKPVEKKKPTESPKVKFEITLPGHFILSGSGRITQFHTIGDRPSDLGQIIVLISTNNLPAQDDYPIVFVNVDNLYDVPVNELKSLRITHLYTKWKIGDDEHSSQNIPIRNNNCMNFNDHFAVALPYELVTKVTAGFLDNAYEIQLRGNKLPPMVDTPKLFGYEKGDRDFGKKYPQKYKRDELDILIAVTKIDAKILAKTMNAFVRGEYPLYPPRVSVDNLNREGVCTNDINAIRVPVKPDLIVKPDTILLAQMTLQVCIGLVGCTPRQLTSSISRMFCVIQDSDSLIPLLKFVSDVNMEISESSQSLDGILTGFAIDTGNSVIFYLEGPKDGHILRVWEMTEDLYPYVKPLFSCSVRYSTRLYPDFVASTVPFNVLKMFIPLGVLLACPPVYARPTLPLPTRSALLKIGRLVSKKKCVPSRHEMPTSAELKSFRLELCVAPRPPPILNLTNMPDHARKSSVQSVSRINWDKK